MFRVQQHFVTHSELHVPAMSVELLLAPILSLLQQRPHLRHHAAHERCCGLAGPGGDGRVPAGRRGPRGEGAAGVLAAIGVEGRVS